MKTKILYVDDQKRYRDELTKTLQSLPVSLVLAEDGLEGLMKYRQEKPDMVIIDAMLPKLHGFQLCRAIRNSKPEGAEIPIVVMSGVFSQDGYEEDAVIKYGANEFMSKPYSPPELVQKVRDYLGLTV